MALCKITNIMFIMLIVLVKNILCNAPKTLDIGSATLIIRLMMHRSNWP